MQGAELKNVLAGIRSGSPVQPYLEGFADELISAGYAFLPIRDYLRSAVHLGVWMDCLALGVEQLGDETIAKFARHECECPC